MLPSTQDRRHQRNSFHVYYVALCKRRGLVPLPGVRAHRERSCLDINGDRVNFDHWGPILNALSLDRSLHFIAIRSKQFGKKLLNDVNTELKAHAVTKSPVIYTRYVLTLLLDAVSECLFKTRTLASIEIEGLPLTKEYIVIITSALKQCPTLQNISFHRSEIGDEGCEVLCSDIKNVPNIVSLDLSHCKVSKMGARAIADLLKYQKIHRMSECWKHTLRYREPDLEAVKGIKRVTLNNNRGVGDDGVLTLLEVIWDDLWLKALDLQDCGLSDRGVRSVLDMLAFNTSLTIVDVQANPGVSDDLVAQVMRMLYHNNISVRPEYHWISTVNPERPKKNLTQMVANRVISQTMSRSNTAKPVKRSATQTLLGRRTSQVARRPATQPAVRQSLPTRPGVPPRKIVSYSKTCLTRGHLSPGKHLRSSHHGVPMHTEQRRLKCQERTSGTPRMVELQEPYPPWYTPPPPSSAGESPQPRPSTCHVEELEKLMKESREERDKVLAERDQVNIERDKMVANLQAEVSRLILERDEALRGQQQLIQFVQQYEVKKKGCVLVEEAMLATLQATFEDLCRAYPFVTTGKK
uniref:Centrosomal protein of 78 kDa n=1 Tax=Timema genevievae TaxID=629358 RepID=A0A7R9JRE1_TIMGE|nr:unnamed protein product [Timema genevievae]